MVMTRPGYAKRPSGLYAPGQAARSHNGQGRYFAQPSVADVRPVDPVLTDMSVGFKNDRFLGDAIAPFKEVSEQSGTFMVWTRDFWFRRQEGAERAPEGPYLRTGYGVTNDTYRTIELGFEKLLGEVTQKASQTPEDLETQDVNFLTNLMQIELEKRAAAAYFVTGVWGTSTTLSGTDQWSDFANSNPITNAQTAMRTVKQNTGGWPNKMFMGLTAWEKLSEHPLILDKYKHTQVGVMTPALVAAALQGSAPSLEIVVGDSIENTAAEGATFVGANIWTDNVLFLVANQPGLGVANGAATLIWNEKGNVPWAVQQYQEENRRSIVSRVFTHAAFKIMSSQHGYIYLDAVA